MHVFNQNSLPPDLRALPHWFTWRHEPDSAGRATKIPYVPGTNRRASSTDPQTWLSFDEAIARLNGDAGRLGFAFTAQAGIVGIDIDGCRNASTEEVSPWALKIVAYLASYAEISPSGTGVHILVRGVLPTGARRRGCVEMYSQGRFFTMTGNRLPDVPNTVNRANLENLHRLMAAGVFDFQKHPKVEALLTGNISGYASQSEADLALCSLLAGLGLSAEDIDSAFRLGPLYREKWDREDYREATIRKAQENVSARRSPCVELLRARNGEPLGCVANAVALLRDSPEWSRVIGFDEFDNRVVMRKPMPGIRSEGAFPRTWSDADDVHALCWLQQTGVLLHSTNSVGSAVQTVAMGVENRFHPLREWLNGLSWDGIERCDYWLTTCFGAQESDFVRAVSRRWLISGIARAFSPGCQADHTLLLIGGQGNGKSSGLRGLVPRADWFADSISTLGSRDSRLELAGKWIVELAELASLRRAEIETIKNFLTERCDHFRQPYARHAIDVPRSCIFAATTNVEDALLDVENRRFWPVHVGKVDVEAIENNRSMLWAEAIHYYRRGDPWWLNSDELKEAAREAQTRAYSKGSRDDLIERWIAEPKQRTPAHEYDDTLPWFESTRARINVTDVLVHGLGLTPGQIKPGDSREVSRCLKHLGFELYQERGGPHRGRRYFIKREEKNNEG